MSKVFFADDDEMTMMLFHHDHHRHHSSSILVVLQSRKDSHYLSFRCCISMYHEEIEGNTHTLHRFFSLVFGDRLQMSVTDFIAEPRDYSKKTTSQGDTD